MLSSPTALWIPNARFLRGWQGCLLLLPPPHSHLRAHPLFMAHRHAQAQKYTLHHTFYFLLLTRTNISELLTAWLLSVHATSVSGRLWTSDLPHPHNTTALTLCFFHRQVSRGHEGDGGPGCCSEQLKQTWAKKSRMASVGSASSTSPATSSFATTTTGYVSSTLTVYVCLRRIVKSVLSSSVLEKSSRHPGVREMWILVHFHPLLYEYQEVGVSGETVGGANSPSGSIKPLQKKKTWRESVINSTSQTQMIDNMKDLWHFCLFLVFMYIVLYSQSLFLFYFYPPKLKHKNRWMETHLNRSRHRYYLSNYPNVICNIVLW